MHGGSFSHEDVSDYNVRDRYIQVSFKDNSKKIFPFCNIESIYIENTK